MGSETPNLDPTAPSPTEPSALEVEGRTERLAPTPEGHRPPRTSLAPTQGGSTDDEPGPPTARATSHTPRPVSRFPRFLGEYELLGEIARGGMGVVYRARQEKLNRLVALKLIRAGSLADADDIRRFRREAEAIAELDHPYIIPIYEIGQEDDQPYFSMKLIDGGNLGAHLARLKEDPAAAAALMAKVARAIHYAHERAILHRDLKPSNILIDAKGEPYVTDFGLAKRIRESLSAGGQTPTDAVLGTPAYMAPEQAAGRARTLTTAADVYGLGATLYEALTGQAPFRGDSPVEILRRVIEAEPTRPHLLNARIDADLETICLKCLQKEPGKRYGSAEALAEDLERWGRGEPIEARPVTVRERLWRWARRRPEIASLTAAVLVVLVAGMAGVLWQWRKAEVSLARLERSLYLSDMKLAEQALENSQLSRVATLVDAHDPKRHGGPAELLGFEWHYFRAVADPEHMEIPTRQTPSEVLRFSPDGALLAMGRIDGFVRFYETATGHSVRTISAHAREVNCLAFDPSGRRLATAGRDRALRVWEIATGHPIPFDSPRFPDVAIGVAYSHDGRWLAAYCRDNTVVVFDARTGAERFRTVLADPRLIRELGSYVEILFNRDDTRLIVIAGNNTMGTTFVLDAADGRQLHAPFEGYTDHGYFLDAEERIYLGGRPEARVYDIVSGKLLPNRFTARRRNITEILGSQRAKILVTFESNGSDITVWDLTNFKELRTFEASRRLSTTGGLDLSPDGQILAIVGGSGVIHLWYNLLGKKLSVASLGSERLTSLALDRTGRVAAVGSSDATVTLWDVTGRRRLHPPLKGHAGRVYGVAFSPDGRTVASAGADGKVRLWSVAEGRELGPPLSCGGGQVLSVSFDPNGRRLAAAGDDRRIMIWEPTTRKVLETWPEAHTGSILGVAFSPDGRLLASTGASGKGHAVLLHDALSGTLRKSLTLGPEAEETGLFFNVAFSPNGRQVVAACALSGRKSVGAVVWDTNSGAVVHRLSGHVGTVYHAIFSPDGRRVITAGDDRTVKLWDLVLGKETLELRRASAVSAVAMTPDGFQLLAVDWDGTLAHWNATPVVRQPR